MVDFLTFVTAVFQRPVALATTPVAPIAYPPFGAVHLRPTTPQYVPLGTVPDDIRMMLDRFCDERRVIRTDVLSASDYTQVWHGYCGQQEVAVALKRAVPPFQGMSREMVHLQVRPIPAHMSRTLSPTLAF